MLRVERAWFAQFVLVLACGVLGWKEELAGAADDAAERRGLEHFEAHVRPLLVRECASCHGEKKQESGLRVDSRAHLLKGGESGAAVVVGKPDGSLLIDAVRHRGGIMMPPNKKLTDTEIAHLETWIRSGAPWPAGETVAGVTLGDQKLLGEQAKGHWAFQPIARPKVPEVSRREWVKTPVDAFVLSEMERHGLAPAPLADRRTLLRRASFDLIGLPPTYEEVQDFERDRSPNAWEKVVERLLASPHYGERWGRHWLDIARYADTKGYTFQQERRYPYSYTYRDYVIRAFNDDVPYDRFLVEQLAADLVEPRGENNASLAALGFITIGRRFNNLHDDIDDRIDVVTRGLMGLTAACARCHDHKYDAVPQEDYYSLYGVFRSLKEPETLPLIGDAQKSPMYASYVAELEKRQKTYDDAVDVERKKLEKELGSNMSDLFTAVLAESRKLQKRPVPTPVKYVKGEPRTPIVQRWRTFLDKQKREPHAVFVPWYELVSLDDVNWTANAAAKLETLRNARVPEGKQPPNAQVLEALRDAKPTSVWDVARVYGRLFDEAAQTPRQTASGGRPSPEETAERLLDVRQWLDGESSPTRVSVAETDALLEPGIRNKLRVVHSKIDAWTATAVGAPARAMVVADATPPFNPVVFLRGDPGRGGKGVPRQFLKVLADEPRRPFTQGSGRLELVRAIVDPKNPLTARVLVNRVWMQHFGKPLVHTPSDFGLRAEPASHPQLLDHLAGRFIDEGWSLKKLHRWLLLSQTYQQSCQDDPAVIGRDPENRWLSRANRRRLEFEPHRDAMLAVAGVLDREPFGRPFDLTASPAVPRRTVYALVDRYDLPEIFRTFDFSNPDASTDTRPVTTVPQQALYAMNSKFANEMAKSLARRVSPGGNGTAEAIDRAVSRLYQFALQREPTPAERLAARSFIANAGTSPPATAQPNPSPWETLAQVLLLTNEFVFLD